jgi:hypothetical protein
MLTAQSKLKIKSQLMSRLKTSLLENFKKKIENLKKILLQAVAATKKDQLTMLKQKSV